MKIFAAISKVEDNADGTITVEGIASTESVDTDGEVVKSAAMEAALPDFMRYGTGNLREMHQPLAAGTVDEITVVDGVTKITSKVVDPVAITKVKAGVYKGFSIGGKVTARDDLNKKHVTGVKLVEISLVDRPANPDAVISMWKSEDLEDTKDGDDLAKGGDDAAAVAAAAAVVTNRSSDFEQVWRSNRDQSIHLKKADLIAHHKALDDAAALQSVAGPALEKLGAIEASLSGEKPAEASKTATTEHVEKRTFTAEERKDAAASGAAMKDGSYPIENTSDLENAIRAFGRAKNKPAAKRHIIRRAKALGATDELPADWRGSTKKAEEAGDLKKGVNLYDLSEMLMLLSSLQRTEQSFENDDIWGSKVDVPAELKTRFGSLLVEFADIVADALEILLGAITEEEADEALERAANPGDLRKLADAAGTDDLAKATADRDMFKAAFETVSTRLETIAPQVADMAKRLKELEDQPLPPKTVGAHAVTKEFDAAGISAEPVMTKAEAQKLLDEMSPDDRAIALIKIAHGNPIQMAPRG